MNDTSLLGRCDLVGMYGDMGRGSGAQWRIGSSETCYALVELVCMDLGREVRQGRPQKNRVWPSIRLRGALIRRTNGKLVSFVMCR